jgi:DNA-binding NtrC family response regulator
MTARQETGRVLVVEDEDAILQLLALLVRRGGAEAVLAGSVAEAQQLGDGIDVAVVDKNLPDGNGVDLLRWLRQTAPEVPVLMVTGYASTESAAEALRLGAFDYILKPFDVAWVTRRIQLALEHRRMAAELRELRARLPEE